MSPEPESRHSARTQLLVSVSDVREANEALAGGAHIVDAKDPSRGALGAVSVQVLQDICLAVGRRRPVTAALGEFEDEDEAARLAFEFARAGVSFVKIAVPSVGDLARAERLIGAAVRGARGADGACGVVAVMYADRCRSDLQDARELLSFFAGAGATGALLDTADKRGPGLCRLTTTRALESWVETAREARLLTALAGQLSADDLAEVSETGVDIVGVRGAACEGGRTGRVTADRVRLLRERCYATPMATAAAIAARHSTKSTPQMGAAKRSQSS